MGLSARATLGVGLLLASSFAAAQARLGDLLDAGAERVSAERFRQEVVQRALQGPLEPGVNVELVYTSAGTLEGAGSGGRFSYASEWSIQVRGTWVPGPNDTVCSTVVLDGPTIRASYPRRCQVWFKLGDRYFVADSDAERQARVLPRTLKALP
jgi:hypothetical protein